MIQGFIDNILYQYSYIQLYGLVFLYFVILYFGFAPLFQQACKFLHRKGLLEVISKQEVTPKQVRFEILHSLKSVIIFGFSGIPLIFLIRHEIIDLVPDTPLNILTGLIILVIWNEIHFFIVHRLMHLPYFMKRVHYVHHRSRVPTVYSVYSFHWFEALLLSTVPVTIALIIPLSATAIFIFPLVSILLNYAGHCNYRFWSGKAPGFLAFGTNHNHHHSRAKRNYGFASGLLDRINNKFFNKS